MVISATGMPLLKTDSQANTASLEEAALTAGIIPISSIAASISSFVIAWGFYFISHRRRL